jgi:hypothetical protein
MMKLTVPFTLGAIFVLNVMGLSQDVAGRAATLAYVNDPANWIDSRISAPMHVVLIIASIVGACCWRAKAD